MLRGTVSFIQITRAGSAFIRMLIYQYDFGRLVSKAQVGILEFIQ
jgi:hypothetical protein